MGIYINTADERRYKLPVFLDAVKAEQIIAVTRTEFRSHPPGSDGKWGVAIVLNGPFDAAAVAFDFGEVQEFTREDDHRPQRWFICSQTWIETIDPATGAQLRKML